jgi:pimeloyl-ACP methyl ester carboxylesterase
MGGFNLIRTMYIKQNICNMYCVSNYSECKKTPVLFLHGLGSASTDFKGVTERECFAAINYLIPDIAGFGKSSKPYEFSYSLDKQADLLKYLLDEFGYDKVDIVAHSMGGVIAILFAQKYPQKVNILILAEANMTPQNASISSKIIGYGSEKAFEERFDEFKEKFNKKGKDQVYRFYHTLSQTTYYSLYRSAASLIEQTQAPFYQNFLTLNAKKYYIRGGKSRHIVDDNTIEDFANHSIQYFVVPEAGHGMMGDNPEVFYNIIQDIIFNNKYKNNIRAEAVAEAARRSGVSRI